MIFEYDLVNETFIFEFPYPPSVNEALAVSVIAKPMMNSFIKKKLRPRFHKTQISKNYSDRCHQWFMIHTAFFKAMNAHLKAWDDAAIPLKVEMIISRPKHYIFNKGKAKHWIKANDVTNRIKLAHDRLSEVIGIDDRYFINAPIQLTYNEQRQEPCLIIVISKTKLLSLEEKMNQLGLPLQNPRPMERVIKDICALRPNTTTP